MTEARKLAISLLIVVVVLAGVGTWLVLGLQQTGRLQASIDRKRQELTTLEDKFRAVPGLRQERQKLASQLDEYETILPNERDLNKLFDTLSEYQKKAGVAIRVVTPVREKQDNKSAATYKKVSYELELSGDYFSFVRFLNLLENHDRFIQVDAFTLKQKDENSLVNEATVRLSTFVYDPKARPAAVAKKSPAASATGKRGGTAAKAAEIPFDLKTELDARFVYASQSSTRDPFSNPLMRRVAVATVPVAKDTTPKNLMSPEQERASADDVEKKLAEVESLLAEGTIEEAEKLVAATEFVRRQLYRDDGCVQRAVQLAADWQRLDIMVRTAKGEKLYRSAEEIYEKMTAAFEAEDYDGVIQLRASLDVALGREITTHKAVDPKTDARHKTVRTPKAPSPPTVEETAPEAAPDPIHERLLEVVRACDALVRRAEVRREFAAATIRIQGTFWSGRGETRKAAAIINGQMLTEGEVLKRAAVRSGRTTKTGTSPSDAEIIVRRIERDKVVFAYRNELIEKSQYTTE